MCIVKNVGIFLYNPVTLSYVMKFTIPLFYHSYGNIHNSLKKSFCALVFSNQGPNKIQTLPLVVMPYKYNV